MSEPITLTERERAVWQAMATVLHRSVFDGARDTGAEIQKVLDASPTASPPRVPGPSAQSYEVGVESGPGQPTDICERLIDRAERLRRHDRSVSDILTAQALDTAATEIRRLRARSDTRRIIEEAPANYYKQGYRAGIEAATEAVDKLRRDPLMRPWPPVADHALCSAVAVIRALTDQPAPDAARKGG